jgi:2,5-diamino-6-(ribosylamino)-4(3H)-pyrimidinone 5'-phosphate reductase
MAMTADGKIDTVARQGARISGAADTARVDRLRAGADAIMVGGRTLLAEDPRLTVRDPELIEERRAAGRPAQPMKVGLASQLTPGAIATDGAFLREGGAAVAVCTSERTDASAVDELREAGARVVVAGASRVDLAAALEALATSMGVERLMVEGGGTLVAALLEAELVDELQLAIAPLLFGGDTAPTPVAGRGWARDAAPVLRLLQTDTSPDGDVIVRYGVSEAAR